MNPLNIARTVVCLLRRHPLRPEDLSAYLDGRLAPPERRRVEEHLAACARCRQELEELRTVVRALRGLSQVPAPRSFRLSPAQVEAARPAARPAWAYGALGTATAAATILFVVLLSGDLLTLEHVEEEAMAPEGSPPAVLMERQAQEAAEEAGEGLPSEADLTAEEAASPEPTVQATPPPEPTAPAGAPPEAYAPAVPSPPPEADEAEKAAAAEEEGDGIGRIALRAGEAAAAAVALAALAGLLVLRRRRPRT